MPRIHPAARADYEAMRAQAAQDADDAAEQAARMAEEAELAFLYDEWLDAERDRDRDDEIDDMLGYYDPFEDSYDPFNFYGDRYDARDDVELTLRMSATPSEVPYRL